MEKYDVAFELTKSAIEKGIIDTHNESNNSSREEDNKYTAKQITDFFNYLLENINTL